MPDSGFLLKCLDDFEEVLSAGVAQRREHSVETFVRLVQCDRQLLKADAESE